MTFMMSYRLRNERRDEARARFQEAGAQPPANVKLIGRWHALTGHGWTVAESDDPIALGKWAEEWNDVLDMQITPVIGDQQLATVFGAQ